MSFSQKAPLAVGSTLWSVPNCPSAQGQLQEAPSALRLVPDLACLLGDRILASPSLQVRLEICPKLTQFGANSAEIAQVIAKRFCWHLSYYSVLAVCWNGAPHVLLDF